MAAGNQRRRGEGRKDGQNRKGGLRNRDEKKRTEKNRRENKTKQNKEREKEGGKNERETKLLGLCYRAAPPCSTISIWERMGQAVENAMYDVCICTMYM